MASTAVPHTSQPSPGSVGQGRFAPLWSTVLPFTADGPVAPAPERQRLIDGPDGPGRPIALRTWGDPRLPVLVLVHGYPDTSRTWDKVAPLLARRFHVVAYDVRGAGDSHIPRRLADYRLERLTTDFEAVIQAVSPDQPVHLVAHDWGSLQGWEFVTEPRLAGRIASYTSCSGPCLDHVGHWYRRRLAEPSLKHIGQLLKQTAKSWYIGVFHLPLLPAVLWRILLGPLWPQWMRFAEGARVEACPSQASDGVHGMKLYRANILPRMLKPRQRVAHAPVLVLEPVHDRYVSPMLNDDLGRWVSQLTRKQIDGGHWVIASQPELFAAHVLAHIARIAQADPAPQAH
jgi:pimeloyl-ACP methyl ester carboxylesterase